MTVIRVDLQPKGYDVVVADAGPEAVAPYVKKLFAPGRLVVITDSTVGGLFADRIEQALVAEGFDVATINVTPGERSKSFTTAEMLLERMSEIDLDRKSVVMSLGGGVVGDLAGFVSSIYKRGCPVVHVPTTLLAQVDSAIGGKTGVNLAHVKNQIGTFHQPSLVFAPIRALRTLPRRQLLNGIAEGIKTAVVLDADLVEWLGQTSDPLHWTDSWLVHLVSRCCAAKASVVEKDEKDDGLRMVLNFGHTLGHALEAVADEDELLHGEAVAIGMAAAIGLSRHLGYCRPQTEAAVLHLLGTFGLPTSAKSFVGRPWSQALRKDKKSAGSQITTVLLHEFGHPLLVKQSVDELTRWFKEWMENDG
ncbi:MAG: 3-dehydroquinate synthase [Myxococcales bacterium]|nr:3-dehydroquinate synthase [Myxococcales bacterium]